MKIYQTRIKLFILQDIPIKQINKKITAFIDQALLNEQELIEFHNSKNFKFYVYDSPYPLPKDQPYKKDQIYIITIRTVDPKLADFFSNKLIHTYTDYIKGLNSEVKIIPPKHIEMLYNLTPIIMKSETGYWRGHLSLEEYQNRIFVNLIKKWNTYNSCKIDENFQLFKLIEFKNTTPIPFACKNITLLGDKLSLYIEDNEMAQKLAYLSLGTGLGENNARGAGFVNYKFI